MAKSKKSEVKSKSQERREAALRKDDSKVEARPIGQGKDPLAEGERLHNPTNTEAETHYDADRSELNDEERASKIRGQNANERAEEHNAQAASGVSDTPQEVEVPERSEEQEAEDAEERQDAVEEALRTTDK
jgi:hypothetical protein